jgi:hypothetical protein
MNAYNTCKYEPDTYKIDTKNRQDTGQNRQIKQIIFMHCMYLYVFVCIMYVSCMYHDSENAFFEMIKADMDMIWKPMNLFVSDTSRYALHDNACIWYESHTTSAYVLHICMYQQCPYGICTYMHTSNCFQSRWWALTHCRMITVTDIPKALKQIQHTHGFETSLKNVLYCCNVPLPGPPL